MLYKEFGTTGKKVSVIGFGGMRFKSAEYNKDDKICAQLVLEAHKKGITYFDTAPGYCGDHSEPIMGEAFKHMKYGEFYVSTSAKKSKTLEIEKNNEVAVGGFWFAANGTAENLGWVKDEKNVDIRAKMKKVFEWFDDHGGEDSPDSIVLRITLTNGVVTDNEQKYGEWQYEVDFVNRTAK